METAALIAIGLYGLLLLFLFAFSLIQLSLAISYLRSRKRSRPLPQLTDDQLPQVTVQLPVYNELYVVERLIDAVCSLDYPADKLLIQVLDDSTDESVELAAKKVAGYAARGMHIVHVRRPDREGYKAGALAYGLQLTQSELVAIFDADFIPSPDFLRRTVPYFRLSPKIGVVQTRWEHLNEDYSLLTRMQAFGLDAHFSVEQAGRNAARHFINFNGTAGIWRRETIEDAGGWQSDTLTEDLDLSYRAQLRGWEFIYLPEVTTPAELPAEMTSLKAQQFRWTKGAAECTRKNLGRVLRARHLPFGHKVHATFHLLSALVFLCTLGVSLLSIPMILIKEHYPQFQLAFYVASAFALSFLILAFFYWVSRPPMPFFRRLVRFVTEFPLFLSVSMGMSLHNAVAVVEGLTGKKSAFIRTPKFALGGSGEAVAAAGLKYRTARISPLTIGEALMAAYFFTGIVIAFRYQEFGLLPFHLMLFIGYFLVTFYTVRHARS